MEVNVSEEKFTIKTEILDIIEDHNVSDEDYREDIKDAVKFLNTNQFENNIKVEEIQTGSVTISSVTIKEERPILYGTEVCEDIKQNWTPQEDRRNEASQEMILGLEGIMLNWSQHNTQDSSEQFIDQSSKINGIVDEKQPQIKYFQRSETTNSGSIRTGAVDGNLMQNETESLKNVFICDICGKKFSIKNDLIQHIKKHPKMYSCTYCSFKANRRNSVKSHINCRHTKKTFFACDYCGYICYFKDSLVSHINAKHTKNVSFSCNLCSYEAYTKKSLVRHVNVRHIKTNGMNCSYCSFTAFRRSILTTHVNAKHTKRNVYNCSYCIYQALSKHHLTRHVNAKHTKTNVFNCALCNYEAYDKGTLTRHINAKHTKTRVFNCSHCSFVAYTKASLTRHDNARHSKTNVFNCSLCSYKAYDKSNLTRHVNALHIKTRVHNCSLCSYTGYDKKTLTRHINAIHTNIKVEKD